jgi:polar amino acid transport system substrate-binding protein
MINNVQLKRKWCLWWGLLLVMLHCNAAPRDELLINFDAADPPFMYGTAQHAQGLYPELIAAAFQRMRQPVRLSAKPWRRTIGEIELGVAGVGGIYKSKERVAKYDFSEPLFVERIVIYYDIKRPLKYQTLSDLNGKRIGVLLGWSYGEEFDNARKAGKFVVEEVAADSQNFDKLVHGRVDAVLAVEQAGNKLMRNIPNAPIARNAGVLTELSTYLAFPKSMQAQALLAQFNQAMQELRRDGTYARIVNNVMSEGK